MAFPRGRLCRTAGHRGRSVLSPQQHSRCVRSDDDRGNIDTPESERDGEDDQVLTLSVLALCVAQPGPAQAGHRAPTARLTAATATTALDGNLFAALEALPDFVPAALIIPNPGKFLSHAREELSALGAAFPMFDPKRLHSAVENRLGFDAIDETHLKEAGVSSSDPLIVAADFAGRQAIVRASLADRRRFEAWADQRSRPGAKLRIADDRAWILYPEAEEQLACAVRDRAVFCQIGLSSGRDPIADLRRFLETPARRMIEQPNTRLAAQRLREGAESYLILQPEAVAELAADAILAHSAHKHRFDPPAARRAAEAEARRTASAVFSQLRAVRAVAAGLSIEQHKLSAEVEMVLDRRGGDLLRGLFRPALAGDATQRWSETPALAKVMLRLRPEIAADLLGRFGLPVSRNVLDGSVAAIAMGLDTECPAAKRGAPSDAAALPFLFPTAVAIGLAGRAGQTERRAIGDALGAPPNSGELLLRRHAYGSPLEVRLVDEAMLIGAGPGAGSAAIRRWNHSQPKDALPAETPFAEVGLDLLAVDAALASGAFSDETRAELQQLERLRQKLRPLITRFERLRIEARSPDHSDQLRIDLTLGR